MDAGLEKDEVHSKESCIDGTEIVEGRSEVQPSLAIITSIIYGHQHNLRQIEAKLKELL